jgi:outer membrane autotransporter protein
MTRYVLAGFAAMCTSLVATSARAESLGCGYVNSGFYDGTYVALNGRLIPNFDIGDRITITVASITGGTFTMKNSASAVRLTWTAPGTQTYTVANAADATSLLLANDTNPSSTVVSASSCTPNPGPAPSDGDRSGAVTKGFLQSRVNGILLNDPGATSLLNRPQMSGPQQYAGAGAAPMSVASNAAAFGAAMGLGAGHSDDAAVSAAGGKTIQFAQSLSQLRRQAAQAQMQKDRMSLGAGDGGTLPLAYETASPWDIWVEGRYSAFDDDGGTIHNKGHVGVLYVGGDYRVAENMIVGVLAQFDWAKDESGALASKVTGNGWMVGPYLSARVHENVYLDVRAAWGRSSNDLTLGATSGDFDTSRWLVKGTLAGNWMHDAWRITPSADLAYIKESADAFTNSAGNFVTAQTASLGRLQFGPEIGYRFAHTADTFIEPFAAIKGVWDFNNPNVAIIDGYVVGPGDFWGRLQGGLNVVTTTGWNIRGLASWDGLGADDYNGYTLQGTINVPLN